MSIKFYIYLTNFKTAGFHPTTPQGISSLDPSLKAYNVLRRGLGTSPQRGGGVEPRGLPISQICESFVIYGIIL